jgi:hypothetical protein
MQIRILCDLFGSPTRRLNYDDIAARNASVLPIITFSVRSLKFDEISARNASTLLEITVSIILDSALLSKFQPV